MTDSPAMTYEHPLAYLLGVEGVALLRAYVGEYGRDFVAARIAEIRRMLDDPSLVAAGMDVDLVGTVDGYRVWATTYDAPRNTLFDFEEPIVREILEGPRRSRAARTTALL